MGVELTREWVEKLLSRLCGVHELAFDFSAQEKLTELCRHWLASQWQPIETALPNIRILAYWPSSPFDDVAIIEAVEWHPEFFSEVEDMPTHWQPLPDPPQ